MADLTTDPTDPRLGRGVDDKPGPQSEAYLILSNEEIAKGFIRPVRLRYIHLTCGAETTMSQKIAETYARKPTFYGSTYCIRCKKHLPVADFKWSNTDEEVGS